MIARPLLTVHNDARRAPKAHSSRALRSGDCVCVKGVSPSLLCFLGCPNPRACLDAGFPRSLPAPRLPSPAGGDVSRRGHCGDFTGAKGIGRLCQVLECRQLSYGRPMCAAPQPCCEALGTAQIQVRSQEAKCLLWCHGTRPTDHPRPRSPVQLKQLQKLRCVRSINQEATRTVAVPD